MTNLTPERKRITDKQRIDALEREALKEPLLLHDRVSGGRKEVVGHYRGLGLWVATGRTLRQAIDQAFPSGPPRIPRPYRRGTR